MNEGNPWVAFVDQLNAHLIWQNRKLLELERLLRSVAQEVAALKDQPTTRIDKIEYKFDQLKVEKLEGTLTIGITPGKGAVDDWTVNGVPLAPSGEVKEANRQVARYIDEELPDAMDRLERHHNRPISAEYRQLVIEDIRKQVDERIDYYYRHLGLERPEGTKALSAAEIVERVKRDIETALANHFRQAAEAGGGEGEEQSS